MTFETIQVELIYNGKEITIECDIKEKIKNLFKKFATIESLDMSSIYFLYEGYKINEKLTISQIINDNDKQKNRIRILVNQINFKNSTDSIPIIKSKEVICPECGDSIKIKIKDYKICLYDCQNGHKIDNILFDEFDKSQNINESNIICDNCKDKNKSNTYRNIFYKCRACKINLCPFCKSIHNQTHNIINYDKRNYECDIHNDNYISYCTTCKKNLCKSCKYEHDDHEIKDFCNLILNKDELKMKMYDLRKDIDIFNNNIKEIINILNKVMENMEKYFKISNDIINNIENKNINYEILNNIDEIINNIDIKKDISMIIKDNNINNKFNNILDMYNKMSKSYIEENNEIMLIYKVNKNENSIKIFDSTFVNNNKKICKISCNGKEYELHERFNLKNFNKNKEVLEIKLKGIINITNMSCMFYGCSSLLTLSGISKWNTSNVTDMHYMFCGCSLITTIPDISNWNTSKVKDMQWMFGRCSSLSYLPDISKWDISSVTDMNWMFCGCTSLSCLPDISKWDTSNVTDMHYMFCGCSTLTYLPDISKWNVMNVTDMSCMFYECSSLAFLPDISKWNTSNVVNMSWMFCDCSSLSFIPDISKWNIKNVNNMNCMFYGCSSLSFLPEISKWNTTNVTKMNWMFDGCSETLKIPSKFRK